MRLLQLHDSGVVSLTRDFVKADDIIPAYAILSHTWGPDAEEVTFDDIVKDISGSQKKEGYGKIRFCGEQAKRDGLKYFWVDSCCINRANYTELSHAINSMFRWYQNSRRCYVYLADVSVDNPSCADYGSIFKNCKWFGRGWTLQELLAPSSVEFFSAQGIRIGDKNTLKQAVHQATGIAIRALQGTPLEQFSIMGFRTHHHHRRRSGILYAWDIWCLHASHIRRRRRECNATTSQRAFEYDC